MRNIKFTEKSKEYFSNENRTETILKGITVVACTVSMILILYMLFSGRSNGYGSPSNELDNANDGSNGISSEEESDSRNSDIPDSSSNLEIVTSPESSPHPDSDVNKSVTLSLTDDEASDLISLSFSERLPISDVELSFFAPDNIEVRGIMDKKDLGEIFSEQDLPLLRAALILSPENLEGELTFSITLEDNGKLHATPTRVLVNSINVTRFIPPAAVELANEALCSLIPEETSLRQITIEDGSITFTLQA